MFEERGQSDDIKQVGSETPPERQRPIDFSGLISVARKQSGLEWPAQILRCHQGQQKRAHELAVGQPDLGARIAALE
jgi:hypothetical protein